jgi:uncharacterized protein
VAERHGRRYLWRMDRDVTWRRLDGFGWERMTLREDASGVVVRSVALTEEWGAAWTIRLASDWTFRSMVLRRTDGAVLRLRKEAGWLLDGRPAPHLAGCVDIDLRATPFTNTLPIRRHAWDGRAASFRMAWVDSDTLEVHPAGQIYTPLGADRWRFQVEDGSFEAVIETDGDGLVTRYPGLFERA